MLSFRLPPFSSALLWVLPFERRAPRQSLFSAGVQLICAEKMNIFLTSIAFLVNNYYFALKKAHPSRRMA